MDAQITSRFKDREVQLIYNYSFMMLSKSEPLVIKLTGKLDGVTLSISFTYDENEGTIWKANGSGKQVSIVLNRWETDFWAENDDPVEMNFANGKTVFLKIGTYSPAAKEFRKLELTFWETI